MPRKSKKVEDKEITILKTVKKTKDAMDKAAKKLCDSNRKILKKQYVFVNGTAYPVLWGDMQIENYPSHNLADAADRLNAALEEAEEAEEEAVLQVYIIPIFCAILLSIVLTYLLVV